jgi:hypothetical protein
VKSGLSILKRSDGPTPRRLRSTGFGRRFSKVAVAFTSAVFVASMVLVVPALAANPSATLDQCANDPSPSSHLDGCNSSATQWVNGNLGASKSSYFEGDSIPYRLTFGNLATAGTHTVTIEWDTTKSSTHALDYITTFNRSVVNANPCLGVSGCVPSTFTTFPIPADPQIVVGACATCITSPGQAAGVFTMFGGTITAVSGYTHTPAGFTGDTSASITVSFTAGVASPVLAWGGHIAQRRVGGVVGAVSPNDLTQSGGWGDTKAAVSIPGSPYHTRLLDLDGAGGNQDRSLSADAVTFPGSITIIKDATPNGSTSFGFTATPNPPLSNFSLVDDGTSANTKLFSGITTFQTSVVNESSIPSGWGFDSVSCSVTSPNGGSYSTTTTTVNIVMKEGELWSCTYLDSLRTGSLIVKKHVINDNGGTASASDFTLHVKSGSSDVTGSPAAGSESGTTYTLVGGSYVVSENTPPAGYTQTGITGDCASDGSVTVVAGATKTCTITNNDNPATIKLVKTVINDNGGTAVVSDFVLKVDTTTVTSGVANGFNAGLHTASEVELAGYTASDWGGDCNADGTINLALGQNAVCTITNNDNPPHVGQITPTATTCSVFNAGTAETLSSLTYSVKNGKVSQVSPGVFFYWLKVNVTAGSGKTFSVTQTITTGNFNTFFTQASGSFVYNSSCVKVGTQSISTSSSGVTTITYTAPTAGLYIFGIKYSASSITGAAAPSPTTTVHYEFTATGTGVPPNNTQTIDLVKK